MRESAAAELVRALVPADTYTVHGERVKVSRESAGGRARKSIIFTFSINFTGSQRLTQLLLL